MTRKQTLSKSDMDRVDSYTVFTDVGEVFFGQKVPSMFHATKKNYKALCTLYPHINWEKPGN